ncbi:MAG TPA: HAMP domain-containing sensor histidine kinase [Thermoanaerobaculia bacterium]|nr:HAMP domain-containing sensor histidine kinase [Thermoanaerobaculia bacterium]
MGSNRSAFAALLSLLALGGALIVLGVLQYRWLGQLADAERKSMKSSMEFAANHASDEFDRDLTRLFVQFQGPLNDASAEVTQQRFDGWVSTARDPRIVKMLWFVPSGHTEQLQRLDPETHSPVPGEWTPELQAAKDVIDLVYGGGPHRMKVVLPNADLLLVPSGERRRREGRPPPPPPPPRREEGREDDGRRPPPPDDGPPGRPPAFTIVQLDRAELVNTVLPDLAQRYFAGQYDIEIARDDGREVLFRSDASKTRFEPELTVPVFRILQFGNGEPPPRMDDEKWILGVRHRHATLDETVSATRRRNLLTTFGVLLVLAGSGIALMLMLRRAEMLRRQQLEFVAGVTHELNTPLAALQSAGQNLKDGVTHEPAQVSRYGAMIVKESRRLGDMVAQVLEYAGMQGRRGARKPSAIVNVEEVVNDAIGQTRWLCEQEQIAVDTQLDADLPPIDGDPRSLSHALQNLIANAVKYAGASKWIGVRARRNGAGVIINVEDAGPGIAPEDARYVFEPFYRGRGADRVRGSGLGLTIVKRIVDEHRGTIAVSRSPRGGAAFTITLPERRNV